MPTQPQSQSAPPSPWHDLKTWDDPKPTAVLVMADGTVLEGVGFGPGGDGHIRFALIENEQRIGQAVRHLRAALTKLG